ncbi:MAG TPA: zinc ribbon domain-containing protein [Blastocatellia bacterium]|nr:zinc ribbon domain-containing protein [Blastocatellia bacterium]
MITCPKCGAENKPAAQMCRMCATPLGSGAPVVPATAISDLAPGEAPCANCGTMNEIGWAFCQQCGGKLQQAPPKAPVAPPPPPAAQPTVLERAPEVPRAQPPQPKPEPQVPYGQQPVPIGQPTVPAHPLVSVPAPPPPAKPVPPRPASATPPPEGTRIVQSENLAATEAGGIACTKCGHKSTIGSAFCAGCGAPLTVDHTMVMSSITSAPTGRLLLIMEGGQSGDVYELKEETLIGRTGGDIAFPHDGFMSGKHARIIRRGTSFVLTDEGSRNGTFVRIKGEVELKPGDMILVGKQLFRFEV